MDQRWARPWFAATFVLVVVELVITCAVAADNTGSHFHSAGARAYSFADVAEHGYLRVILNGIVITLFFWALAGGAVWIDHRLPER